MDMNSLQRLAGLGALPNSAVERGGPDGEC